MREENEALYATGRKRGRPKGSKNKPKEKQVAGRNAAGQSEPKTAEEQAEHQAEPKEAEGPPGEAEAATREKSRSQRAARVSICQTGRQTLRRRCKKNMRIIGFLQPDLQ